MNAAKQIAKRLSAMPVKFTTDEALLLAEELGHAYRIATYHGVSEYADELALVPEHHRANVRKRLEASYRQKQAEQALQAQIDAGQAVWLTIGDKS